MNNYILRITCSDKKGLVYEISRILLENGLNIERNDEFVDKEKKLFFMRTEFMGIIDETKMEFELHQILPENAKVHLSANSVKEVVLLVTKEHHCLADLLIRNKYKELNFTILAVIGNHKDLQDLTDKFGIPFHFISSAGVTREEHEDEMFRVLEGYKFDFIVFAKFMRIVTPTFVEKFKHKIINIHHSFLPAFIGANPYKKAFQRGVKMIGATSHFVTNDLDEGPIIYQDIIKVSHSHNAKDLATLGKDVEKKVLSNALKLVFEDRVFIDENKTIIFE